MQKNGATNQIFCFAFTSISFVADTHISSEYVCGDNFFIIFFFEKKKSYALLDVLTFIFIYRFWSANI